MGEHSVEKDAPTMPRVSHCDRTTDCPEPVDHNRRCPKFNSEFWANVKVRPRGQVQEPIVLGRNLRVALAEALRERFLAFRLHHASLGTVASPEDFADLFTEWSRAAVDEVVTEAQADAWEEGFEAHRDLAAQVALWNLTEGSASVTDRPNPYRFTHDLPAPVSAPCGCAWDGDHCPHCGTVCHSSGDGFSPAHTLRCHNARVLSPAVGPHSRRTQHRDRGDGRMREHHFTDQQATTIALHGLINDMHHVLGRITWALVLGTLTEGVRAVVEVAHGRWIEASPDVLFAVCVGLMAVETAKRQRKYHPASSAGVGTEAGDE